MSTVQDKEFAEKIIHIRRVAKVTKGGKNFHFTALVVIGNMKGQVGSGLGKSNEVPDAIRKAIEKAKKNLINISEDEIRSKIEERNKARSDKNYELADKIRQDLLDKGILIEDKDGTTSWKLK